MAVFRLLTLCSACAAAAWTTSGALMAGEMQAVRLSAADTHTFFGYYDVPAADRSDRLAHRVAFRDRLPTADDEAELGWIPLDGRGAFTVFAATRAWNFQQGAMLQWLGDGSGRVFYNETAPGRNGYRGVLLDLASGARRHTDRALANLSTDGRWGLAIDFDRMHDFRPGYGYAAQDDPRAGVAHPRDDGVWLCELATGRSTLVLSLAALHERLGSLSPFMEGKLLVNHITFNPSASRFVFLVRNFPLLDGPFLHDGHCSYSPDRRWLLYDSYPDNHRQQHLYLYDLRERRGSKIGSFQAMPVPVVDLRCDLHPRWLPDGRIGFDSTHEGFRGVYHVDARSLIRGGEP